MAARRAPSQRLMDRLRGLGLDLPEGACIRRTYVGRHQRAEGAWVWVVELDASQVRSIGSQWPVKTLLKGEIVLDQQSITGDWHVYPASGTPRGDHD